MFLRKVTKNYILSDSIEIDKADPNLKSYFTSPYPQEGHGYCFSTFKNNIMIPDEFEGCYALLLDFDGAMDKPDILEITNKYKLNFILISSENHYIIKNSSRCPRYHLVLPLSTCITDRTALAELYSQVHMLFKYRDNAYMHASDRYLKYSPEKAEYVANLDNDNNIDQLDFISVLSDGDKFYFGSNVNFHKRKKRDGEEYQVFTVNDPGSLVIEDLNGDIVDWSEYEGTIYCPFHANTVIHKAVLNHTSTKSEIVCQEYNHIFILEDKKVPRTPDQLVYESIYELDDFALKGYTVGIIHGQTEIYFIKKDSDSEIVLYSEKTFKTAVNILYKKLYPANTMSGLQYFYRSQTSKKLYNIIDNPTLRGKTLKQGYLTNLNLFSSYPLRKPHSSTLPEIINVMQEKGWRFVLQRYAPHITLLLQNLMETDFDIDGLFWFLNWLAGIFTYLKKSQTAVIFHSNAKSGFSILYNSILSPLFGLARVANVANSQVISSYNEFLEGRTLVVVNEPAFYSKDSHQMLTNMLNWIHYDEVTICKRNQPSYLLKGNCSFILNTHSGLPKQVSPNDSTFTVFKSFIPVMSLRGPDGTLLNTDLLISRVQRELHNFSQILLAWNFDLELFNTPYCNELRNMLLNKNCSALHELLQDLTNCVSPADLLNASNTQASDLFIKIANIYSNPEQSFAPTATLTELYNARTGSDWTANKMSREINMLLGVSSQTARTGKNKQPTKGFFISSLATGLKNLEGTLYAERGKDYKPLTSRDLDRKPKTPSAPISFSGLTQINSSDHMIFSSRHLYSLKFPGIQIQNPATGHTAEAHIAIQATDRTENLLIKSEIMAIRPFIRIYGDENSLDLEPLESLYYLTQSDLNQYFVLSEANDLAKYLLQEANITAEIVPPDTAYFLDRTDLPPLSCLSFYMDLSSSSLALPNLIVHVYSHNKIDNLIDYFHPVMHFLLFFPVIKPNSLSFSTIYK